MSSPGAAKSLDRKLAAIRANRDCGEFVLADAKDADMAFGIGAPGLSPESHPGRTRFRTLDEYRNVIREIVRQELVDVMLTSASTNEKLTIDEGLFENSPVTPAARANDASDVHVVRGGRYLAEAARPFRTANLDHLQCGHLDCMPSERARGANLGLYSVTFVNKLDEDLRTLEAYKSFREEAERKGFKHFLEVFNPNVPGAVDPGLEASYVNDMIARSLAGVAEAGRPEFLKVVYNGPKATEELAGYDSNLILGVLGGSAGTTYDAFKLLDESRKYGARVALFGRKINQAENQFAFIRFLRLIADRVIGPEDAVKAYHAVLERLGTRPHRSLEEDLVLRTDVMKYLTVKTFSLPPRNAAMSDAPKRPLVTMSASATPGILNPAASATTAGDSDGTGCDGSSKKKCGCGCAGKRTEDGKPDFAAMTSAERLAFHQKRIARLLGE